MPSSSPAQARFMAAVAHGWHPSYVKAPPVAVAKEFNQADTAQHSGWQKLDQARHLARILTGRPAARG